MPRKREFRRLRRVRVVGLASTVGIGLGAISTLNAAGDALHHRPGGLAGVVICPVVVALGVGGVTWAGRAGMQAAAADRRELEARGLSDGLPMGVYTEGGRMGLEAADSLLVLGGLMLTLGGILGIAVASGTNAGWLAALAFSLVGVVPAAMLLRVGTGTTYWLTTEGVERARWPRRSVRWAEVQRVVPLDRGIPTDQLGFAQALELRTAEPPRGWTGWLAPDFVLKANLVQVDVGTLRAMIDRLAPQAAVKAHPAATRRRPPRVPRPAAPSRILGRTVSPADRRLARFVVWSTVAGIALVAVGVGALMLPSPPQYPGSVRGASAPYGLLAIGLACLVVPWVEVVRRLRRGPGEQGHHTRS